MKRSPKPTSLSRLRAKMREVDVQRPSHYHQRHGFHPVPQTIPPFCERVELMTGGRGWIWHEGQWREVLPGLLIWNSPGDQTIGRSDFENPYRCLSLNIFSKFRHGMGIPRFSQVANLEEVKAFTEEIVRLSFDDHFDRRVLGDYVVSRLLFWMCLHEQQARHTELPPPLQAALAWIEQHYAEKCPVEELARQAGWSVPHFHEAFRKHLGTTPHQFLARHRLRAARERLVTTSHPVKRVAADCGFADASALIHAFKAEVGTTPKAYRHRYMHLVPG